MKQFRFVCFFLVRFTIHRLCLILEYFGLFSASSASNASANYVFMKSESSAAVTNQRLTMHAIGWFSGMFANFLVCCKQHILFDVCLIHMKWKIPAKQKNSYDARVNRFEENRVVEIHNRRPMIGIRQKIIDNLAKNGENCVNGTSIFTWISILIRLKWLRTIWCVDLSIRHQALKAKTWSAQKHPTYFR